MNANKYFVAAMLMFAQPAHAQECEGWINVTPVASPPASTSPLLVYDTVRRVTTMFTVVATPQQHWETWVWDGVNWELRATGLSGDVGQGAMTFDSNRSVAVRFGGDQGFGDYDALWEWDGAQWIEHDPLQSPWPHGRYRHAMTFDRDRAVTLMYGGALGYNGDDEGEFPPVWEWDGADWTPREVVAGPRGKADHILTFDPVRHVTVLFGGGTDKRTWEWDGSTWFDMGENADTRRQGAAAVFHEHLGKVVRFGGLIPSGGSDTNDLQAWDGSKWTVIPADVRPPPRRQHGMAYDSDRGAIVLFGGNIGGVGFNDTWEYVCPGPCYPDLDKNGVLDLFDFLAFVNSFNAGDAGPADCDQSGVLDLFDFLCFVNAFNAGCP